MYTLFRSRKMKITAKRFALVLAAAVMAAAGSARTFTDSTGRTVEVPSSIKKIAPSGPLAQLVLYTVCPDKLAGVAKKFNAQQMTVIPQKYAKLPQFGQFYGKNANLNMEALMGAAPDVVIDIGEKKKTEKEDMDNLQKQIGIPVIFIEAKTTTMDKAYTMLGDLTGDKDTAVKLASYCRSVLDTAATRKAQIKKTRSVYFATGTGLDTDAQGSFHAEAIDVIGAKNAADIAAQSTGGTTKVSFEQLLMWNPDVIIVEGDKLYQTIKADSLWNKLDAVKNGRLYHIPDVPYSFISNPPSVNRIIGIS